MQYTYVTRENFFMGFSRGVKFETVWEGGRFLTIVVKTGKK